MESVREYKPGVANTETDYEDDRVEKCKQVFQAYYSRMEEVLPVKEILPYLVNNGIVTMEAVSLATEKTSLEKLCGLLKGPIWRSISEGYPDSFIKMLCIMQLLQNKACSSLSKEICVKLDISSEMVEAMSADIKGRYIIFFYELGG